LQTTAAPSRRREIRHIAGVSEGSVPHVGAMAGGRLLFFPCSFAAKSTPAFAKAARRKGSRRRLL
jgi:hypothetical protein